MRHASRQWQGAYNTSRVDNYSRQLLQLSAGNTMTTANRTIDPGLQTEFSTNNQTVQAHRTHQNYENYESQPYGRTYWMSHRSPERELTKDHQDHQPHRDRMEQDNIMNASSTSPWNDMIASRNPKIAIEACSPKTTITCRNCNQYYESRNKLHQHLRDSCKKAVKSKVADGKDCNMPTTQATPRKGISPQPKSSQTKTTGRVATSQNGEKQGDLCNKRQGCALQYDVA